MVMRQKIFIDRGVQGVLVGRIMLYWSALMLYFGLSLGCFQWMQYPEASAVEHLHAIFDQVWPCLPTFVLILPLVIFDIVRLSNRFVGPIYRLRMHLARLTENTSTYPLNFRDGDYWQQLADPINELQRNILVLEKEIVRLAAIEKAIESAIDARALAQGAKSAELSEQETPNLDIPADSESLSQGPPIAPLASNESGSWNGASVASASVASAL